MIRLAWRAVLVGGLAAACPWQGGMPDVLNEAGASASIAAAARRAGIAGRALGLDSEGSLLAPGFALRDVSETHLPPSAVTANSSMDAHAADIDLDGDPDLLVAVEFGYNLLLVNDGAGRFHSASDRLRPRMIHDSEDAAAADFDGDGDIDLVFISEDDQINELYIQGDEGRFELDEAKMPVGGVTNGLAVEDLDGDGDPDLILGNAGPNVVLRNAGDASFADASSDFLPGTGAATTQDLEFGDIDGDGDRDLIVGNEDGNQLLLRDGDRFVDASEGALPARLGAMSRSGDEETREADFGDVDRDGDLDLLLANVAFRAGKDPRNRLLLNDGSGRFRDASDRIPDQAFHSVDGDFADIDGDGDLDILLANAFGAGFVIWANDGGGAYEDVTARVLPEGLAGNFTDVEAADYDGDGRLDLYLARYNARDGQPSSDLLFLGVGPSVLHLPWLGDRAPNG